MEDAIQQYLRKRADLATRPLIADPWDGVEHVIVIPALAERPNLFRTLRTVASNPREDLKRTLVICVVNNRAEPNASIEQIEDNRLTLDVLDAFVRGRKPEECREFADSGLRLGYIDTSSPGRELPPKGGVGFARKIGLDWGLAVLADQGRPKGLLFSLDADTLVEPNYIGAVCEHFVARDGWAGVIAYEHRVESSDDEAAIVCYEVFLRYYVLGLRYARSPYAFNSVGSTMVCHATAYAAVSGMNTRQAGEDFYFLQQLAKTGRVDEIETTCVHPSARASDRVPFGTGQRVRRYLSRSQDEYKVYAPETFRVLKEWLSTVAVRLSEDGPELLARARRIAEPLAVFLGEQGFGEAWRNLQANARDESQLAAQFHRWFDGFRTLKLVHYLRDHGMPECGMFEAVDELLGWVGDHRPRPDIAGIEADLDRQRVFLTLLRRQPVR